MNEINRQIISGMIGAIALAVLAMSTDYVFWFSLSISAAIGLGTYFTIPAKKDPDEVDLAPGVTQADLNAATALMGDYIRKFEDINARAADPDLRRSIGEMIEMLKKIRKNFQDDPRDLAISSAPQFLDQYLVRSYDIVAQYVRLSSMALDDRRKERLSDAEDTIRRIQAGFEDFYHECLKNDFMDLEVDSETLKAIIDMDM